MQFEERVDAVEARIAESESRQGALTSTEGEGEGQKEKEAEEKGEGEEKDGANERT